MIDMVRIIEYFEIKRVRRGDRTAFVLYLSVSFRSMGFNFQQTLANTQKIV